MRRYLVHLVEERGVSRSAHSQAVSALRFLFEKVLGRPQVVRDIPRPKRHKSLPGVLSRPEVDALLKAVRHPTSRALVMADDARLDRIKLLRLPLGTGNDAADAQTFDEAYDLIEQKMGKIRDELEDVDIGFAFLPAFRGRGYALEAAAATLDYGRTTLGLHRVAAIVSPGNADSLQLLGRSHHTGMLDRRYDHASRFAATKSQQGKVVGFCPAAGENDPIGVHAGRVRAQDPPKTFAGILQNLPRSAAKLVGTGGVTRR